MKRSGLNNTNAKLLLLSLAFAFILLTIPLVSSVGVITILKPAQGNSISGSYVISGDLDSNSGGPLNLTRAWFWYMEANGTNVTIASFIENVSNVQFNTTYVTSGRWDVDDLVFWMTVARGNGTVSDANTTDSSTGVDIDNGNPTATISSATFDSTANGYTIKGSQIITAGLNADNTLGLSSCRAIFTNIRNGTVTDTGTTMTGNACANTTLQANVICNVGESYNVVVQATDGNTDRTNSSSRRINCVSNKGDSGDSGGDGGAGGTSQSIVGSAKGFRSSIGNFFGWIWDKTLGRIF